MNRRLTMAEWAVATFGVNPIRASFLASDSGAEPVEAVVTFEAKLPTSDMWGPPS